MAVVAASLGALNPMGGESPSQDPLRKKHYKDLLDKFLSAIQGATNEKFDLVKPFYPAPITEEKFNMTKAAQKLEEMKTIRVSSKDVFALEKAYYELSKSGTTDSRLWQFSKTEGPDAGGMYFFDVSARDDDSWFNPMPGPDSGQKGLEFLMPPGVTMSPIMQGQAPDVQHDPLSNLSTASDLNVHPYIKEMLRGKKAGEILSGVIKDPITESAKNKGVELTEKVTKLLSDNKDKNSVERLNLVQKELGEEAMNIAGAMIYGKPAQAVL